MSLSTVLNETDEASECIGRMMVRVQVISMFLKIWTLAIWLLHLHHCVKHRISQYCYLLIFQFVIWDNLSTKAFAKLIHLIAVHLPKGAKLPKSVHKLKQFFNEIFPDYHQLLVCVGEMSAGVATLNNLLLYLWLPNLRTKVEGKFDYTIISKHIEAVHLRYCIIATIAISPSSEAKWTILMGLTY